MSLSARVCCDLTGCQTEKGDLNHWYVVSQTTSGVHIYEWDQAPPAAMSEGKHFCGIAHALLHISKLMTPDKTNPARESTLELKPPLARDGSVLDSAGVELPAETEPNTSSPAVGQERA